MCYVQGAVIRVVWPKCTVAMGKLARTEIKSLYPEAVVSYISQCSLLASTRNCGKLMGSALQAYKYARRLGKQPCRLTRTVCRIAALESQEREINTSSSILAGIIW